MKKKKIAIWSSVGAVLLIAGAFILQSSMAKPNLGKKVKSKEKNTPEQLQVLQKLGFKNSDNLNLGETYDFVTNPNLVKYYRDKYNLQYFSIIGMEKFSKEYNIILGPVDKFIGHIPSKNIVEMQGNVNKMVGEPVPTLFFVSNGLESIEAAGIGHVPEDFLTPDAITDLLRHDFGQDLYTSLKTEYRSYYPENKYGTAYIHMAKKPESSTVTPDLRVAAPDFDFNKDGMTLDGIELVKKKPIDPMVVMPVRDGYVVLTKWVD